MAKTENKPPKMVILVCKHAVSSVYGTFSKGQRIDVPEEVAEAWVKDGSCSKSEEKDAGNS